MEVDTRNGVEYWLSIEKEVKDALFILRTWSHLKVATEDNLFWVRGFTQSEIESTKVLSLPYSCRYYLFGAKLYLHRGRLPSRIEPTLLWTPIERALKLSLPEENFNYFGLNHAHKISLVSSCIEYPVDATVVSLEALSNYALTAPKIRLAHLQWTLLGNDLALISGVPLLPIQGEDFYHFHDFIIPAGWKLRYENLVNLYLNAIRETVGYWYLIDTEHKIKKIRKSDFTALSRGSITLSARYRAELSELLADEE